MAKKQATTEVLDASVTVNVCPRLTGTTGTVTGATTEVPADALRLAERNTLRPTAPQSLVWS